MHRLFVVIGAVLILAGCNTLFKESYQKIMVQTSGVENAECVLETEKNKYRLLTPGFAQVERSRYPMTVSCEKANYIIGTKTIESKVRMAHSQLNVFNLFTGVPYDVASNSIYEYPSSVMIEMQRVSSPVQLPAVVIETLKKKPSAAPKPAPLVSAPDSGAAEKSLSKSLRK